MNQTPQNAMTSPSNSLRLARQFQAVADDVGKFLDFGILIVMGEDDRLALGL